MAVAFKFDSDVEIPYKAAFFLMTSRGRPFCLQNKVQLYKGLCRNASCNSQIKNENEACFRKDLSTSGFTKPRKQQLKCTALKLDLSN